jgi:hypothetical protein
MLAQAASVASRYYAFGADEVVYFEENHSTLQRGMLHTAAEGLRK